MSTKRRRTGARYRRHAVYSSLLLLAAFVVALHAPLVASGLVTLYLTWSPWHYTAQNFGLASMFLRRRGAAGERRCSGAVCASRSSSRMASSSCGCTRARERPPTTRFPSAATRRASSPSGFPHRVSLPLGALVLAGYLATLGAALVLILRATTLRAAGPTLALLLTQVLWFSLPITVPLLGFASGLDPLEWSHRDYYFRWIAIGHASQYLWITAYYARRASGWSGYGSYLAKAAMAATAVWVLPVVVFAPGALGTFSFDAGLAMLVGSAANIHHFILDGVIWKLRSRPVARVLLEAQPADAAPIEPVAAHPWLRRAAWSALAVLLAIRVFWSWELQFAYPAALAREDFDAAERDLEPARVVRLRRLVAPPRSRLGPLPARSRARARAVRAQRRAAPEREGLGQHRATCMRTARIGARRWRPTKPASPSRPTIRICSRARGSRRSSSAIRRARARCSSAPIKAPPAGRSHAAPARARAARGRRARRQLLAARLAPASAFIPARACDPP